MRLVPLSLFTESQVARKTVKSQLVQAIAQRYYAAANGVDCMKTRAEDKALIIDGMTIGQVTNPGR